MNKVKVYKLRPDAKTPTRNLSTDCGLDIYAWEQVFIPKGETRKVKTGIAIEIPEGYVGRISDRSGMAAKGLIVGAGVIDPGYSGDYTVVLHNHSNKDHQDLYNQDTCKSQDGYLVNYGDKIAQVLIYKVETPEIEIVEELWTKERGDSGWGSSDNKGNK